MATRIGQKKSQATQSKKTEGTAKRSSSLEQNVPSLDEMGASKDNSDAGPQGGDVSLIEERLTRSGLDLVISDADVEAAIDELRAVPAPRFNGVIKELQQKGLLDTLENELNVENRRALMGVLVSKGAATIVKPKGMPPLPGQDHATMRPLVKVSAEMGPDIREAADAFNKNSVRDYAKSREAYVDRMRNKVSNAKSMIELREIGAPTQPFDVKGAIEEVYGDKTDSKNRRLAAKHIGDWVGGHSLRPEADARLITSFKEKIQLLNNERADGEVWVNAALTVKLGSRSDAIAGLGGVKVGAEVASVGEVKAEMKGVGTFKSALLSGEASAGGSYDSRNDSFTPAGAVKVETILSEHESSDLKKVDTKVLGVKIKSDGVTNEYETTLSPLAMLKGLAESFNKDDPLALEKSPKDLPNDVAGAALEMGIKHSPSKAEIEGKGAMTVSSESMSVKLEVGVGMKGVDAKAVRAHALAKKYKKLKLGYLDRPPELGDNIAWSNLDPGLREYYTLNLGWSESQWTHLQAKMNPKPLDIPFTAR